MSHNNENTMIDNHCEAFGDSSDKYTSLLNLLKRADEQSVRKLESITMKCRENVQQMKQQLIVDKYLGRMWHKNVWFDCSIQLATGCFKGDRHRRLSYTVSEVEREFKKINVLQLEGHIQHMCDDYNKDPYGFIETMCKQDSKSFHTKRAETKCRKMKNHHDRGDSILLNIVITDAYIKGFEVKPGTNIFPGTFKPRHNPCSPIGIGYLSIACYLKKTHNRRSYTRLTTCDYTADDILMDKAIVKRFMGTHLTPCTYEDEQVIMNFHKQRMNTIKNTGVDPVNIFQHQHPLRCHARSSSDHGIIETVDSDCDYDNDDDASDDTDIEECIELYDKLSDDEKRSEIADMLGLDINDPLVYQIMQGDNDDNNT